MTHTFPKGTAVALGNFDGLHLGHRVIVKACSEAAKKEGLTSLVWSFRRHPDEFLKKDSSPAYLLTPEKKEELVLDLGIDALILREFEDFRDMEPRDFCQRVLVEELNAKKVFCGFNFRFGKKGSGDAQFLSRFLEEKGIEVVVADAVCLEGDTVSSTRIRALLKDGRPEVAARLLGRPHSITLPVVSGKKLGRTLGFPTINQVIPPALAPLRHGVYGVLCRWGETERFGLCNVGRRPTVDKDDLVVAETFLFDFEGDLYDLEITTEFLFFHRPEVKFSSLEELKNQIEQDRTEVLARWKEQA